jgi:predicted ATP-dependent serine protease
VTELAAVSRDDPRAANSSTSTRIEALKLTARELETGYTIAVLLGRQGERACLLGLLDRARGGDSGVLVLRGEAGIGKTLLIEDVAEAARSQGVPVVAARGDEAEAMIPFAALDG